MNPTIHTVPDFSARCAQRAAKPSGDRGLLPRLLRLLSPGQRPARLDLEALDEHRLRDLGLADGLLPRRADPFRS